MKLRMVLGMIFCLVIMSGLAAAEVRTYRQFKDVSANEKGKVKQSDNKGDLFEYTYNVDVANKTITRIKIRRLDETTARDDATVYTITQKPQLLGSDAGNGGPVLIAVQKDGNEILELSHRFAFTMRTSPFSQVITGVYKRVYYTDHDKDRDGDRSPSKHKH